MDEMTDAARQEAQEAAARRDANPRWKAYMGMQQELDDLLATFREGIDFMHGEGGKPVLLQPGAERIVGYFGWHTDLELSYLDPDPDKKGGVPSHVWVTCRVVQPEVEKDNHDRVWQRGTLTTGFGAMTLTEAGNNLNTAVKMAGKRALIDAVKRAAGVSDRFTQDVPPDTDERRSARAPEVIAEPPADEGRVYGRGEPPEMRPIPVDPRQEVIRTLDYRRGEARRLFEQKRTAAYIITSRLQQQYGVPTIDELNLNQLEDLIDRLTHPEKYGKKGDR